MPYFRNDTKNQSIIVPFDPSNTQNKNKSTNNLLNIEKKIQNIGRKTQKSKQHMRQQKNITHKKVSFDLQKNNVNHYYCSDLKPSWETKIESGEPMQGEFKVKKVPYISLKDLFNS